MAYQVWSVVFGEQPSASKWNILGTNDAGFHDGTAIGDDAILSRHIADGQVLPAHLSNAARTWEELGRTTLGSAGDLITVSGFAAKKYLMIIFNAVASGGTLDTNIIFNNDSGANYAAHYTVNYSATPTAGVSLSSVPIESSSTASGGSTENVLYMYNPSSGDKIFQWKNVHQNAGLTAATEPRILEGVGMWNNSNQVTRFDWVNGGTGNFPIGAEVIVMGMD